MARRRLQHIHAAQNAMEQSSQIDMSGASTGPHPFPYRTACAISTQTTCITTLFMEAALPERGGLADGEHALRILLNRRCAARAIEGLAKLKKAEKCGMLAQIDPLKVYKVADHLTKPENNAKERRECEKGQMGGKQSKGKG
ncbi:hypothetical protein JCM3770_002760 [Rhodotorula araucariae]